MAYTMTGNIKKIFPTQTFPSGFSKREVVVTNTADRFPQDVKFDCLKEKEEILKGFKEGDEVTVHFDIRGREYNGRYFVDLNAWKMEAGSAAAPASSGGSAPADVEPEDTTDYSESENDDIPF
jgi:single-strand DNA-binding protein